MDTASTALLVPYDQPWPVSLKYAFEVFHERSECYTLFRCPRESSTKIKIWHCCFFGLPHLALATL